MSYRTIPNVQAALAQLANNGVWPMVDSGAPTSGTSGTGAGFAGPGSTYLDVTNKNLYINLGTQLSPSWTLIGGTNGASIPQQISGNASVAQNTGPFATDTYLLGSAISAPPGGFVAKARYYCCFDMVKTAAGIAQFTITLRIGTAGTTADTAICTFAFAAGTAAIDTGTFEVFATFQTVGSGTSAVVSGVAYCGHALAATGLISTGAAGQGQIANQSSGFNSTTAGLIIGLSVNGGASFSGTNNVVQTELHQF